MQIILACVTVLINPAVAFIQFLLNMCSILYSHQSIFSFTTSVFILINTYDWSGSRQCHSDAHIVILFRYIYPGVFVVVPVLLCSFSVSGLKTTKNLHATSSTSRPRQNTINMFINNNKEHIEYYTLRLCTALCVCAYNLPFLLFRTNLERRYTAQLLSSRDVIPLPLSTT